MIFVWTLLILAVLGFFVFRALDHRLEKTEYSLCFKDLPESFDGYKIAQISDLHGNSPKGLTEAVKGFAPDVIACTGDCYDGVQNKEQTTQLLCSLVSIAPVYFVTGNHEYYLKGFSEQTDLLKKGGITLLRNECAILHKNGESLELCGIDDPDLDHRWSYERRLQQLETNFASLPAKESFRILLSHRADLFEQSAGANADLILFGHIHGGHWRFFGRGLIAPNDGRGISFFPRYDAGIFRYNKTALAVSRGLGDQLRIPRLFNRPEIVLITLHRENNSAFAEMK